MSHEYQRRIAVWQETRQIAQRYPRPYVARHRYDASDAVPQRTHARTKIDVRNADSIEIGEELLRQGLNPLILIFADNRFAGGSVDLGSGAQEEELFRRTNLCEALGQSLYPIMPDEALVACNVTVFRAPGSNNYDFIDPPFAAHFIACPGIHNPKLDHSGRMTAEDVHLLRVKVHVILQAAQQMGCDALVLGPLGCGAWRCPPTQIAEIFRDELAAYAGVFSTVIFACLEIRSLTILCRTVAEYQIIGHFAKSSGLTGVFKTNAI